MFRTVICDLLGIRYPILQGAMQGAGGPDLVAAVSNAGGLGILPTFGGTEEQLYRDIRATRALTDKPIAVNITPMGRAFTEARARICIEMDVPVVTTGRADPGEDAVHLLKDAGVIVVPVVPTVAHACRVEREGADAIVASGCEAGGHVGTVSTFPLVPLVVDAVKVPVIAAGGIADGRGFLAALALGAVGIQIGTRFVAADESAAGPGYRQAIIDAQETDTIASDAMTGAPVRVVSSPEIIRYEHEKRSGADALRLKTLRKEIRSGKVRAATAGQISGMIRDVRPVRQIVDEIVSDAARIAERLHALAQH